MDVFKQKLNLSRPKVISLIVLGVLVLTLPLLLYTVKQQVRLRPKAQTAVAQIYFASNSYTADPSATVSLLVNPAGSPLSYARIKVDFDNTKVQLTANPVIPSTNPLTTPILIDSISTANANGEVVIVLGLPPGATGPSTTFEYAQLAFAAVHPNPDTTGLTIPDTDIQLVDTSNPPVVVPYTGQGTNLDLNPAQATNTPPVPSDTPPSNTPVPTPTTYVYPTLTPIPTPTSTSSNGGTNGCGGTCGSNTNCNSDLYCYAGFCRAPACPLSTNCSCTAPTATPKPTATPVPGNNNNYYPTSPPVPTVVGSTPIAYVTSAPYAANPTLSPDLANNPFFGGQKTEPVQVPVSPAVKLSWLARLLLYVQDLLRRIFGSR